MSLIFKNVVTEPQKQMRGKASQKKKNIRIGGHHKLERISQNVSMYFFNTYVVAQFYP